MSNHPATYDGDPAAHKSLSVQHHGLSSAQLGLLAGCILAACLIPVLPAQGNAPSSLTPEQQEQFTAARKDFAAEHWPEALTRLKALHSAQPDDLPITKYMAEAAINAGDPAYAIDVLKPIETRSAGDWQAKSLLAHAYAQTHQDTARDAELQALVALRKDTADPGFRKVMQIVVERIPLENGGSALLFYSLQPWSRYNIYEMARIYDGTGQQVQRITLESSDLDQTLWAKNHVQQAAAGMRVFTIDGYTEQLAANGQRTQTHSTYGFLDGQPTYKAFYDRVVSIAEGKASASSKTSGLTTPQP